MYGRGGGGRLEQRGHSEKQILNLFPESEKTV